VSATPIIINTIRWNTLLARLTSSGAGDRALSQNADSDAHASHHSRSSSSHLTLPPAPQLLLATAVHGTLLWEASSHQAKLALNRVTEYFADFNDLRVAPTLHILPILGERYPLAIERIYRLLSWMNHLHRIQQSIDLEHLRDVTRKDARHFLISLEGMPLYAVDYIAMHGLGVRTIPIDERLAALLVAEKVIEEANLAAFTPTQLASLQDQLLEATPGESITSINAALRAWSDHDGVPPKREPNNAFAPQHDFSHVVPASVTPTQAHGSPSIAESLLERTQSASSSSSVVSPQPRSAAKKKPASTKKSPKTSNSVPDTTSSEPQARSTEYSLDCMDALPTTPPPPTPSIAPAHSDLADPPSQP